MISFRKQEPIFKERKIVGYLKDFVLYTICESGNIYAHYSNGIAKGFAASHFSLLEGFERDSTFEKIYEGDEVVIKFGSK